jgi:leucyl/phenylalanyl-tRNA--protein transferase
LYYLAEAPWLAEDERYDFEPRANTTGIVCLGGNLSPGMLLSAYSQGIFPWYSDGSPITWWSPDPRFVLMPFDLHVSESTRKTIRKGRYRTTLDTAFDRVIAGCAGQYRPGQGGTWITDEMLEAYSELHRLGWAHSCEAWDEDGLAGGCYGVSIGDCFFGESMFHLRPDASKVAFISLAWKLREDGVAFIDSQVHTDYLESLGAAEIPRSTYLGLLSAHVGAPSRKGSWGERWPDFPDSIAMRELLARSGKSGRGEPAVP